MVDSEEDSQTCMEDTDEDVQTNVLSSKKRHACTYPGCKSSFGKPSRLVTHLRVHSGEVSKEYVQF